MAFDLTSKYQRRYRLSSFFATSSVTRKQSINWHPVTSFLVHDHSCDIGDEVKVISNPFVNVIRFFLLHLWCRSKIFSICSNQIFSSWSNVCIWINRLITVPTSRPYQQLLEQPEKHCDYELIFQAHQWRRKRFI